MNNLRIGFCMTGSFCTLNDVVASVEELAADGAEITPVLSETVAATDTRFVKAEELKVRLEHISGRVPISTIVGAEPIGPKKTLNAVVVAPCTGNTLAKIAAGITDTSVTMAVKAHLRNNRPVIIAVSTNDALAANLRNIGELYNRKNIYFVPFYQDDAAGKPTSLVADFSLIKPTVAEALKGRQIQPIIREK